MVAFSPDATRLAVGCQDSIAVDVLSASDLKRLFSADRPGIANGQLSLVTWTSDGALLAAGGYRDGHGTTILRWEQGGKGERTTLPAADDNVSSIVPLDRGGFVCASADPAFGAAATSGRSPA
jgi:hypothetical protein